jgi:hypothetical protein
MLSDRLDALASHFRAWALCPRPIELDQRIAALLHTELAEAAALARGIEGRPVPPHLAGAPLPEGVASLAEARAGRRVA